MEPPIPKQPFPMKYMVPGVWYYGDTGNLPYEIDPQLIAYYVHCESGMRPQDFVAWLQAELDTLDAIDPYCDK